MKPELVSEDQLDKLFDLHCQKCGVLACERNDGQTLLCRTEVTRFARAVLEELGVVQVIEVPESADLLERRHEFAMDEHAARIKDVLRHVRLEDGAVLVRVKEKPWHLNA